MANLTAYIASEEALLNDIKNSAAVLGVSVKDFLVQAAANEIGRQSMALNNTLIKFLLGYEAALEAVVDEMEKTKPPAMADATRAELKDYAMACFSWLGFFDWKTFTDNTVLINSIDDIYKVSKPRVDKLKGKYE